MATIIYQSEAFVRFMSGSFWALVIGILTGIVLLINCLKTGNNLSSIIFLLLILIFITITILRRFKNQRRREVFVLLSSLSATYRNNDIPYFKL